MQNIQLTNLDCNCSARKCHKWLNAIYQGVEIAKLVKSSLGIVQKLYFGPFEVCYSNIVLRFGNLEPYTKYQGQVIIDASMRCSGLPDSIFIMGINITFIQAHFE